MGLNNEVIKRAEEDLKKSHEDRIKISVHGGDIKLFTKSGLIIANGYRRIVIGGRGHYIEFSDGQLVMDNIHVPEDQKWRFQSAFSFYNEYRTNEDNVKIYHQKRLVEYADYKVEMWYISPFDLKTEDINELMKPLKKRLKTKSFLDDIE